MASPPQSERPATPILDSPSEYPAGAMDEADGASMPRQRLVDPVFTGLVALLAGPDEVHFGVHQHVLLETSAFFRDALDGSVDGSVGRAQSGVIELPLTSPSTVKRYVQWAYGFVFGGAPSPATRLESTLPELIRLYFFADKIVAPDLKIAVADALGSFATFESMKPELLHGSWTPLRESDPLRLLLVDWFINDYRTFYRNVDFVAHLYESRYAPLPEGFLREVMKKALKLGMKNKRFLTEISAAFFAEHRCRYHEHENGEQCPDIQGPFCDHGCRTIRRL